MTLRFIHFSAANKIGDEHQSGQSSFTSKVIPCITFLCCFLFQNLYGQLPSFLFAKQSTGQQSASASVATDAAGNVYVTGTFYVSASFGGITLTSHGGTDIYVVKYDANGNVIWANEGGGPTTYDGSSAIVIDAAGDVVVTGGYTTSATFGSTNISSTLGSAGFIVKYDPSGNLLLAKSVGAGPGGSSISITSSSTDAAGNIYTTGTFYGTVTLGTTTLIAPGLGDNDAYIAKFDPSGNPLWANKGGSTSTSGDYGWGIITNAAGESYISGYYTANASFSGIPLSNHGSADIFIAKYDASGAILWAKGAGGTNLDEGRALAFDNSGNIYVTGYFLSPSFTFDGYSFTGQGGWDSFLIKLDPMGTILWTNQSSGTASENTTGVAVDINDNSVYILGYFDPSFSTTANFGGTVLTSAGSWDIFLAKYDLSGNFIWALRIGDTSDDLVGRIAVDANKNIYLVGYFTDHTTIGSFSLSNPAQQSSFITKLGMQVPPTITSFTPSSGTVGTTVTITGTNFDPTPADNVVKFNGTSAIVTASTATTITTTVPLGATTGTVSVTVGDNTGISGSSFSVVSPPTITSFTPLSGPVGGTVTITGTNFSTTPSTNVVFFGATKALVSSATTTQLAVTVPTGATYQPISVMVNGLTAYSSKPYSVSFLGGGSIDACSFAPKIDFSTGVYPNYVIIGDLDGDGKPDLVVNNGNSNSLSVFRNTISSPGSISSGSFATKADFTTGAGPGGLAIGDLDGDGKLDLVSINYNSGTLSIFKNTSSPGAISFAPKVDFDTDIAPNNAAIADIDGDGKPEIIVTSLNRAALYLFQNISSPGSITSGSFAPRVTFNISSALGVTIGDLDGDGKPDVAVSTYADNQRIAVFRNVSSPNIINTSSLAPKVYFGTGDHSDEVAIADFDNDGKPDLSVTNDGTVSFLRNVSSPGNINSGSFSTKVDFAAGIYPHGLSVSDIDGDGKLDFVVSDNNNPGISIFKNVSVAGSISSTSFNSKVFFSTGQFTNGVAIGDLDGDGKPDLVVTNRTANSISIFLNTMGSILNAPTSPVNGSVCGSGAVTLSVSGGTNGQYVWYTLPTGGTAITGEVDSSYTTPSLSATTSYYVAINNGSCESARTKVDAIINTPPTQPTITASGATTFCQGATVTLSSPGFSSYLWSDGSTVYPRVVSTSDSLSLQVTDANGCQSIPSNPITITVNPLPAAPTVSSTQPIVNGVIVLCTESNETTTLSVPAGFVSYQWNGGYTSSSFTTSQSGSYSATVTDTNGCTSIGSAAISINSTSCISITSETLTTQIEGTVSISLISLIATLKTLDVSSIKVVKQPSSGAVASVDNGELTVDYKGVQFSGTDSVTIQVCDVDGNCKTQEFSIDVIGDIKVYNAVSPNGDGKNEFFNLEYIDVIASKQQNQVSIYNRWGDEVFSISDYNNHERVFNGYSNSGSKLPAGTYFYKISFTSDKSKTGYLELKY